MALLSELMLLKFFIKTPPPDDAIANCPDVLISPLFSICVPSPDELMPKAVVVILPPFSFLIVEPTPLDKIPTE